MLPNNILNKFTIYEANLKLKLFSKSKLLRTLTQKSLVDAMNMFYHWLIKKLLQPIAGQNIARLEKVYTESRQSHIAAERDQGQRTLLVNLL